MASRHPAVDAAWIEALGKSVGQQLGKAIARHLQEALADAVDLAAASRRSAGSDGGRGRRAPGVPGCTEGDCPNPVLARGLCRSHYYKARYRAQKGTAAVRSKKR